MTYKNHLLFGWFYFESLLLLYALRGTQTLYSHIMRMRVVGIYGEETQETAQATRRVTLTKLTSSE